MVCSFVLLDMNEATRDLSDRCEECEARIEEFVEGSHNEYEKQEE